MKNELGRNYVPTEPITLGNTTIDCNFIKYVDFNIIPQVYLLLISQYIIRQNCDWESVVSNITFMEQYSVLSWKEI